MDAGIAITTSVTLVGFASTRRILYSRSTSLLVAFTSFLSIFCCRSGETPGLTLKVVKGGSRKQLIVRGTYFPRKIYDTVPLQNLSEQNSDLLNKGFSSVLSRKNPCRT